MGDELDKLRRENKDLKNACLDYDAELDEKKCQEKELSLEIVRLHEIVPPLEEGMKKKSEKFENAVKMHSEELRRRDKRIQDLTCDLAEQTSNEASKDELIETQSARLDQQEEGFAAIVRLKDEAIAELASTVARKDEIIETQSARFDQRKEQFAAIVRSKDEAIAELTSTVARKDEIIEMQSALFDQRQKELSRSKVEEIAGLRCTIMTLKEKSEKLSENTEKEKRQFMHQLREKDEQIRYLESLISEGEDASVKPENPLTEMFENSIERRKQQEIESQELENGLVVLQTQAEAQMHKVCVMFSAIWSHEENGKNEFTIEGNTDINSYQLPAPKAIIG